MLLSSNGPEQNLREVICRIGLPLKVVAKEVGLKSETCLLWWSGLSKLPSGTKYDRIGSFLGIDIENGDLNEVDFSTLRGRLAKTNWQLPNRYAFAPLSFVSSSRHILEVIRLQFGLKAKTDYLVRVGISDIYFDNIQNPISLRFFEDTLEEFVRLGNSTAALASLSEALAMTVEETSLSSLFVKTKSYEEAYQQIELSTSRFDLNFEYRFSIGKTGFDLLAKPSEALVENMQNEQYGSKLLYKYRSSLFGNIVTLCGLQPIKLKVKSCVSQGDPYCHYTAEYSDPPDCAAFGEALPTFARLNKKLKVL